MHARSGTTSGSSDFVFRFLFFRKKKPPGRATIGRTQADHFCTGTCKSNRTIKFCKEIKRNKRKRRQIIATAIAA
jgi:hypothetical protein